MKIEQRRRLTDLFSRGETVEIIDPEAPDKPVYVWLRKMTSADAETAYLKASAKRASFLSLGKGDNPSDAYLALKAEIDLFEKDDLISWCVANEIVQRRDLIEARVGFADEWSEDQYLFGLQTRILDEDFRAKELENPEDAECVRIREELGRFYDQVEEEIAKESRKIERDYEDQSTEEIREHVLKTMMEAQADAAWLNEFQRCQVWLCCFDNENHQERWFAYREEVDGLQHEVLSFLAAKLEEIHVADMEGKDSQQTPPS